MKAATILALVGAANAHQLQWRGPAINFDLASSWSSGTTSTGGQPMNWPAPDGSYNPRDVTFGSMYGPVSSAFSSSVNVGSGITFNALHGPASMIFEAGAQLSFGNAGNTPVTFLPAGPDFSEPTSTPSAEASAFQYNCILNWVIKSPNGQPSNDIPLMAPQASDSVTIPSGGFYISTFMQNIAAYMINDYSDTSQPPMCHTAQQGIVLTGADRPGVSTMDWGSSPNGCPNVFNSGSQTIQTSCGNLVVSQLTGSLPGDVVWVYSCPSGATSCGPNGNLAVYFNNATGMATNGTITAATVTSTPSGVVITVPGKTGGSVTIGPGGLPSVSDPDSESGSKASSNVLLYVIVIAAIVVIAVAVVLYMKKDKSKAPPAPARTNGVGFENPLYDEDPNRANGGPQYDNTDEANGGYMDVPVADDNDGMYEDPENVGELDLGAGDTDGYMDVPAEGSGGYLDVDDAGVDDDQDDF